MLNLLHPPFTIMLVPLEIQLDSLSSSTSTIIFGHSYPPQPHTPASHITPIRVSPVQFQDPTSRGIIYINYYKPDVPPSPLQLRTGMQVQIFGRLRLRLRPIWGLSGPDIYFSYVDEESSEHFWLVVDRHFVKRTWGEWRKDYMAFWRQPQSVYYRNRHCKKFLLILVSLLFFIFMVTFAAIIFKVAKPSN